MFYKLRGKDMAKYAYRDKERKDIIYADKAIEEDRDNAFFVLIVCVMQNYIFVQWMGVKVPILERQNRILSILRIVRLGIVLQSLIQTTMMNPNLFMKMQ